MSDKILADILRNKQITTSDKDDEPDWESPHNSEWILAVDSRDNIIVISHPSIHDSFFDNGYEAEYIGLPMYGGKDMPMGVYKCICSYHTSTDFESGHIDEWWFEIESKTPLWQQLEMPEMS